MRQTNVSQNAAPQAPPPAAPAAPPAPSATIVRSGALGAPAASYTRADIAALRHRGSELSNQLTSADGRRRAIQERLRRADGPDRAGLEQRLGVLDNRIARLELDIEENGRALASPAASLAMATSNRDFTPSRSREKVIDGMVPISIVFTLFVLFPLAVARARALWRRGALPRSASLPADTVQRLERMEQGIDAIAIEVERVSEGQRFVTRLMTERGLALDAGPGPMEPVRVPEANRVSVER